MVGAADRWVGPGTVAGWEASGFWRVQVGGGVEYLRTWQFERVPAAGDNVGVWYRSEQSQGYLFAGPERAEPPAVEPPAPGRPGPAPVAQRGLFDEPAPAPEPCATCGAVEQEHRPGGFCYSIGESRYSGRPEES